ncbi:YaaC family protein [Chryseobacterium indologenes]|uniref:YaaC family protein n=1 Tax=Chryseobacterium indologenes TaxID=253 RepID=UPI0023E864FF|nr:YaaC family protein [Chryseobacterium indologenes]WET51654.1 YaaC family protein [Chryseobacterium indologenes]
MTEIENKYGFPLFSRTTNNIYLGNHKKLIIADIWAFWDYIIKKANYEKEFMNSLLEQAKNFYLAAENSPIKSKPLLYYYSFLNFAKIIINIEKKYGRVSYMHGVGEKHHNKFSNSTIKIAEKKTSTINVSCEFLNVLDNNIITTPQTINVKDYLAHCVGIHRTYSEIYNIDEIFIRLDDIKAFKHGKELIAQARVFCNDDKYNLLIAQGYNINKIDNDFIWEEKVITTGYNTTRNSYCQLSSHLRTKGLWYFINDKGYTVYLSTHNTNRYSTEAIIYNTMFFLGSITRYHPYMFDKIFSDKEQWLMSEFLTTQPKQFLYLTTAKILGQNVMKAYSSF